MEANDFYKYIVRNGNSFKIVKDNISYGNYRELSDALYERDRFVQSDWNWDDVLQLPETENIYEEMDLPEFQHDYSYIYRTVQNYKIHGDGAFYVSFKNKESAYEYAEKTGGEVVECDIVYRIKKRINGKLKYFGQYKTYEEAEQRVKELKQNGWKNE